MVYWLGSERAKAFLSTEAHHPSPYASNPGTLLFFIPLELRRGVVALLRQRARVEPDGLREVSVFDAMLTKAERQRALERAMDDNETSCLCCMSRPRAVRNQPCGHAIYCELCTIRSVRANGLTCAYRCAVPRLVVVSPTGDLPLLNITETYLAEPEPEGRAFESLDAFLLAKLESDDAEVAEAAQAALALRWPFPIDAQGHATVPEGETELPAQAFMYCRSLISITLPASLTTIGEYVFAHCASLVLVSHSGGITSIGKYAFLGCRSLTLTSLPDGITSIGQCAFVNCRSLALTSLPNRLTSIGDRAFENCTSLAPTKLPDGLTSIGKYAFARCDSLVLGSLPDSITSIGSGAFENCHSLALTSLPDGLTLSSIGLNAFLGCNSLALTRLPDGLTSISQYAFLRVLADGGMLSLLGWRRVCLHLLVDTFALGTLYLACYTLYHYYMSLKARCI